MEHLSGRYRLQYSDNLYFAVCKVYIIVLYDLRYFIQSIYLCLRSLLKICFQLNNGFEVIIFKYRCLDFYFFI